MAEDKKVTTKQFIPYAELTEEQKSRVDSSDSSQRRKAAEQGLGLDKLINDAYDHIRMAVAEQGYGLEQLMNDEEWTIVLAVARQGYALDRLAHSDDPMIREEVVLQGFITEDLLNDKNPLVLAACVKQGAGLPEIMDRLESVLENASYADTGDYRDGSDELIDAFIEQGYGLDKISTLGNIAQSKYDESCYEQRWFDVESERSLIEAEGDDPDTLLEGIEAERQAAWEKGYSFAPRVQKALEKAGYQSLEQWVAQNPDKCGLPENRRS